MRFKYAKENGQFEPISQEEGDRLLMGGVGPFPKGVRRDAVTDVLKDKRPLSDLTAEEREIAAKYYEETVAKNVGGKLQDWAEKFNQARAKYLREGGDHPGTTIYEFIEKQGRTIP